MERFQTTYLVFAKRLHVRDKLQRLIAIGTRVDTGISMQCNGRNEAQM